MKIKLGLKKLSNDIFSILSVRFVLVKGLTNDVNYFHN